MPTYNEAENLPLALASAEGAEELLVVDSFSTDNTIELARLAGAKIIQKQYISPSDQKNWALAQAGCPWVLFLDADERLTPALRAALEALFRTGDPPADAYRIRRQNYFLGKRVRFSGWQNDAPVRLVRRDRCRFRDTQVHETVETEGLRVETLRPPMLHFTCTDLAVFIEKQRRYARWSALDHRERTPRVTFFHLWAKPAFRFFKHFVLKGGFLDGKTGLQISWLMALGVRWRYEALQDMLRKEG